MTDLLGYDLDVLNMVAGWATDAGLPISLMFCVVWGESKFNLDAEGDGGLAHGILQVRTDVHGHDRAYWTGIDGAQRSWAEMRGRWLTRGLASFGDIHVRWELNPIRTLQTFWFAAQGANAAVVAQRAPDVTREGIRVFEAWMQAKESSVTVVPQPPIIWKPAHAMNYKPGRPPGVQWEALCVHTTAGGATIEALDGWFQNPAAGVSTHFGIGPSVAGEVEIHQYVSLDNTAYAHGIVNNPTAQIVTDNGSLSPNVWAVGCELVDGGIPGNHSAAQIAALGWLFAWLWQERIAPSAAETGATLDRSRILGHYQIDSVNRAHCPSWSEARFAALIADMQARLTGQPTPPAPHPSPPIDARAALDALTIAAAMAEQTAAALSKAAADYRRVVETYRT